MIAGCSYALVLRHHDYTCILTNALLLLVMNQDVVKLGDLAKSYRLDNYVRIYKHSDLWQLYVCVYLFVALSSTDLSASLGTMIYSYCFGRAINLLAQF